MNKEKPFWGSVTLLQCDEEPIVLEKIMNEESRNTETEMFRYGAFQDVPTDSSTIFTFSIKSSLFISWQFVYDKKLYSIVVESTNYLVHTYIVLLTDSMKMLSKKTPTERLNIVADNVKKWFFEPDSVNIHVFTPKSDFIVKIEANSRCFPQFSPSTYISNEAKLIDKIYTAVISGKTILLYAQSASLASAAVLSAISLLDPMKYYGNFITYLRKGDPRYDEVLNGSTEYLIVGTSSEELMGSCNQFDLKINTIHSKGSVNNTLKNDIIVKNTNFYHQLDWIFAMSLKKDPYSAILGVKLGGKNLEKLIKITKIEKEDLISFFTTEAFKEWKMQNIIIPRLRETMLSFIPRKVVENHEINELLIIKDFIEKNIEKTKEDKHLYAVLKNHLRLIDEKLDNNN